MLTSLCRAVVLAGAALLIAASPATMIAATPDGGHLLGNRQAPLKLTEYISYTCPHCAHFNEQAEAPLLLGPVAAGKISVEIRPYIRNPVDIAASLLVACGGPTRFRRLHDLFLARQAQWLAPAANLTDAQQQRWNNGPVSARLRAIASDLKLYQMMENTGISRVRADQCLSDEAAQHRLAAGTEAATQAGVEGTPGFAINGVILAGTYDWATLAPQLAARE